MAELAQKLQSIVNEWTSCADCNNAYPEWADISRGIIICTQCAGIHRSLGTHVSQVRSLTLDVWQQAWVDKMIQSNEIFNKEYEYHVPSEYIKPNEYSSQELREKYITAKYIGLDTTTINLNPLFHINGPNKDKPPLPPIYDDAIDPSKNDEYNGQGGDNGELNDDEKPTKNGTKPWKDHRIKNKNNKIKSHTRNDSGMKHYTGVLHINCINAINLPEGTMMNRKRSTYCSFDNGYQEIKSKIIKKNNNPQWKQKLILSVNENECIKIAIYPDNKKDDELCYQFLDIKDYPNIDYKYQIRDFEMIIKPKYAKNKQYKKEGQKILFNFDITYNKMSNEIDSDISKLKRNRESLILENTKILSPNDDNDDDINNEYSISTNTVNINNEYSITTPYEDSMQIDSIREEEYDDDIDDKFDDNKLNDDEEEEKNSSQSTSPPPPGRPGDTEDVFITYQDDKDNEQYHRVRVSHNISGVIDGIFEDDEIKLAIAENNDNDNDEDEQQQEKEMMKSTENVHESTTFNYYNNNYDYNILRKEKDNNNNDKMSKYIQELINFNEINNRNDLDSIDINNIIDAMCKVIKVNENKMVNILTETIRKLNEYIFLDKNWTISSEQDDDEKYETIIDRLRDLRNELMNNNNLSLNLMDTFVELSDIKYDRQYLVQNLIMIAPFSKHNSLIFKNMLKSDDSDNIEHVLNEILKMHSNDSQKVHDVIPLILKSINNNNVNVKKLSVKVLSKFSKDIFIQKCILNFENKEILRILSLIDHLSFVNISYNMILSISIYSNHWNCIKKYVAQILVDEYDDDQYDQNQNHILQLITLENVKQNTYILNENDLIKIINENIHEIKQNGLEFDDILFISKSKQILDFQTKTECALDIQSFIRCQNERKLYQNIKKTEKIKKLKNDEIYQENINLKQNLDLKESEYKQQTKIINDHKNEIEKLKEIIDKLQSDSIKNNNEEINKLKKENDKLKKENFLQKNEICNIRQEHLLDKQKFAMTMMNEMNNLREQLKIIGQQQLIYEKQQQQSHQDNNNKNNNNNTSYFGRFW